ncbi:MAG: efflux RND transporter periplasmic adaptor subunit, partial [Nevskiales bacterium]
CDPTLYEIHSPENGIIIEKHIVQGELLNGESHPFVIANLDEVWINITVNQKDIQKFHLGQKVIISTGINDTEVQSEIDYISPTVSEETRSATARVVIDNKDGNWRPGLFVTANVKLSETEVTVVIPKTALEQLDNQTVVFKKTAEGFVPQKITTGREDHQSVEVLSGLNAGDEYVAEHAFVLKAELGKGEAEHEH